MSRAKQPKPEGGLGRPPRTAAPSRGRQRADLMVAQYLARQRPGNMPSIGVADLITAIGDAFDDLADSLAALIEGIDAEEPRDGEAGRARVNAARAALWRFKGQPPGRI
jgi:hypothetical protein